MSTWQTQTGPAVGIERGTLLIGIGCRFFLESVGEGRPNFLYEVIAVWPDGKNLRVAMVDRRDGTARLADFNDLVFNLKEMRDGHGGR